MKLAERFDESFRTTQKILDTYISNATGRHKKRRLLGLKWFGRTEQLKIHLGQSTTYKVGLVELGQRRNWQDEAVSIMSTIQRHGMKSVVDEQHKQAAIAQNELKKARESLKETRFLMGLNPRHQEARRHLRRAEARARSTAELGKKIGLIRDTFHRDQRRPIPDYFAPTV